MASLGTLFLIVAVLVAAIFLCSKALKKEADKETKLVTVTSGKSSEIMSQADNIRGKMELQAQLEVALFSSIRGEEVYTFRVPRLTKGPWQTLSCLSVFHQSVYLFDVDKKTGALYRAKGLLHYLDENAKRTSFFGIRIDPPSSIEKRIETKSADEAARFCMKEFPDHFGPKFFNSMLEKYKAQLVTER